MNKLQAQAAQQTTIAKIAMCLLMAFVLIGFVFSGCAKKEEKSSSQATPVAKPVATPAPTPKPTPTPEPLTAHTVAERKVTDTPAKTQVDVSVVVTGDKSEPALRKLLNAFYKKESSSTGYKHREHPSHLRIALYATQDHFKSGSQWMGMLTMTEGWAEPQIEIKPEALADLSAKPEKKQGLSEDVRKNIFFEYVQAEDTADQTANQKYPSPNQYNEQLAFAEKEAERLKMLLAKKYKITRAQLEEIRKEGGSRNWPIPY